MRTSTAPASGARAREDLEHPSLHRRDVVRGQAGGRVGRERRVERGVARDEQIGDVAVHRDPAVVGHAAPLFHLSYAVQRNARDFRVLGPHPSEAHGLLGATR
jgi:hypothetical protein